MNSGENRSHNGCRVGAVDFELISLHEVCIDVGANPVREHLFIIWSPTIRSYAPHLSAIRQVGQLRIDL